jgi:predicted house-cleaning noncanonical NTP pyrophosphatase (MazG superfamily)
MTEKLVRDLTAEVVLSSRSEVLNVRVAKPEEMNSFLRKKILEEAQEVFSASCKDNLAEELADLLEVIKALAENENVVDQMFSKREAKYLERGGFSKGLVLIGECKK